MPWRSRVPLLVTPDDNWIFAWLVGPVSVISPALLSVPELPKKLPRELLLPRTRVLPARLFHTALFWNSIASPSSRVTFPTLLIVRWSRLVPKGLLPRVAVPLLTVWPLPLRVPPVQFQTLSMVTLPEPVSVPPLCVKFATSKLPPALTLSVPFSRVRFWMLAAPLTVICGEKPLRSTAPWPVTEAPSEDVVRVAEVRADVEDA